MMREEFKKYWPIAITIFLLLVLAVVLVWFAVDLNNLRRAGMFRTARSLNFRRQQAGPIFQPSQIQGWMTFSYINFSFRLPADYLAAKLDIADPNYLNATPDKFADARKLNRGVFIVSVRQAVAAYLIEGGR